MCYGSFDPTFYFRSSMGAAGFSDGSSPLHISSWAAAFSLLGGINGAGGSLMGMIERCSLLPSFTCLFLLVCYPFPALIPPKVCSIAISLAFGGIDVSCTNGFTTFYEFASAEAFLSSFSLLFQVFLFMMRWMTRLAD